MPHRHGLSIGNIAARTALASEKAASRLPRLTALGNCPSGRRRRRTSGTPTGAEMLVLFLPVFPVLPHLLLLTIIPLRAFGTAAHKGIVGLADGIVYRLAHQLIQIFKIAAVQPFRQSVTELLSQGVAAHIFTH